MTYDEVLKHLQTIAEIPLNQEDENFKRVIPLMFTYAEGRIYRELDFLQTTTSTPSTLVPFVREQIIPPNVLIVRSITVQVPTGYTWQNRFRQETLERVSLEALDMIWPDDYITPGIPQKFAIIGEQPPLPPQRLAMVLRLGPLPNWPFGVKFTGVIRPELLSPVNPETFISRVYPELLCAACMVFIAGYQRDFGAQADDPAKAMSWNGVYSDLRNGVTLDVARTKGEGAGWTSMPPAPAAQPRAP